LDRWFDHPRAWPRLHLHVAGNGRQDVHFWNKRKI